MSSEHCHPLDLWGTSCRHGTVYALRHRFMLLLPNAMLVSIPGPSPPAVPPFQLPSPAHPSHLLSY